MTNGSLLDDMQLDYTIFKAKYAEAARAGLLTEEQVYWRFVFND